MNLNPSQIAKGWLGTLCRQLAFLTLALLALTGCGSIQQSVDPVRLSPEDTICIVENPDVRAGFLETFEATLNLMKVPYQVVSERALPEKCEWTATYIGKWRWDIKLYMTYAEIKVYYNGGLRGQVVYDSTNAGLNTNKFIDAEPKIREMVEQVIQFGPSS